MTEEEAGKSLQTDGGMIWGLIEEIWGAGIGKGVQWHGFWGPMGVIYEQKKIWVVHITNHLDMYLRPLSFSLGELFTRD